MSQETLGKEEDVDKRMAAAWLNADPALELDMFATGTEVGRFIRAVAPLEGKLLVSVANLKMGDRPIEFAVSAEYTPNAAKAAKAEMPRDPAGARFVVVAGTGDFSEESMGQVVAAINFEFDQRTAFIRKVGSSVPGSLAAQKGITFSGTQALCGMLALVHKLNDDTDTAANGAEKSERAERDGADLTRVTLKDESTITAHIRHCTLPGDAAARQVGYLPRERRAGRDCIRKEKEVAWNTRSWYENFGFTLDKISDPDLLDADIYMGLDVTPRGHLQTGERGKVTRPSVIKGGMCNPGCVPGAESDGCVPGETCNADLAKDPFKPNDQQRVKDADFVPAIFELAEKLDACAVQGGAAGLEPPYVQSIKWVPA
jgi:hypothetical protein